MNSTLMNKDPDMFIEQAHLFILDRKSHLFMARDFEDTKHTRHISRRIQFVTNNEEWSLQKTVWCEGGLQLADIGTRDVKGC